MNKKDIIISLLKQNFVCSILFVIAKIFPIKMHDRIYRTFVNIMKNLKVNKVKVMINGEPLIIDPTDQWSLEVYVEWKVYDYKEIEAIKKFIPGDFCFIDVGANVGAWSFSLAKHFSKIYSVEPDVRCFNCMLEAKDRFKYENVLIANIALSDSSSEGMLFACERHIGDARIYDPGDSNRMGGVPIKIINFDTFVEQFGINDKKMFIKLDTQGVETKVLKGMINTINSSEDIIIFTEFVDHALKSAGSSMDEYLELFRDLGFKPINLFDGLKEISWDEAKIFDIYNKDCCFRYQKK